MKKWMLYTHFGAFLAGLTFCASIYWLMDIRVDKVHVTEIVKRVYDTPWVVTGTYMHGCRKISLGRFVDGEYQETTISDMEAVYKLGDTARIPIEP
jgi:hypothetical protein